MISNNILNIGKTNYYHKDKIVPSPVGSTTYDDFIRRLDNQFDYTIGYVPVEAAHRPDIISNVFYNTPSYWWLILVVNNIPDPFNGLNAGDQIKIPNL
jgi:hypothetical protein